MPDETYLNLKENRDIGQVINASFCFLRISYFKMLGNLLLFSAPLFVIGAVILSGLQFVTFHDTSLGVVYIYTQPEYYYSLLFFFLGYVMSYTIVTNYILQYTETGSADFDHKTILSKVKRDYPKMLLATFLYWLASIAGLILLVIPGVYYSISNSLTRSILILEKKNISESFNESRRLVENNWWRTFGLFYLAYILTGMLTVPFQIPYYIVVFVLRLHITSGGYEDYHLFHTISIVLSYIGTCLLYPIIVTAMAIYTFSLQESKDHVSLLESIENIGIQPEKPKEDEGSY